MPWPKHSRHPLIRYLGGNRNSGHSARGKYKHPYYSRRCAICGNDYKTGGVKLIPPCPRCGA